MRADKLTTKFQEALADAQSLALANDNNFIEPPHLLQALIDQPDSGTASLLSRAGVAVPKLKSALELAVKNLPKVEGTGGEVSVSRELGNLLNLTDKEATKRGDQFIASEWFLLALVNDKGETGRLFRENGANVKSLESAIIASKNHSEAINWSPRLLASLSVRLSKLPSSRETDTSPPVPSTLGKFLTANSSADFSFGTATPARDSSDAVPLSGWSINACNKCGGSIKLLSLARASDCASANAS